MMNKHSKKLTAVILSVFLAVSVVSGCQEEQNQSESPQDNTDAFDTVSQMNVQNDDIVNQIALEAKETNNQISMTVWCSQEESALMADLIQQFEETYKNVDYEFDIKTENVNVSKSGLLLESPEDGADVLFFPSEHLEEFSSALLPVSADYHDKVFEENMSHAFSCACYDGVLYGFPKTPLTQSLLFYDKRVFNEKDVDSLETMIQKSAEQNKSVLFNLNNVFYCTNMFLSSEVEINYKNGIQSANFDSNQGLNAARAICHLVQQNGKGMKTYFDFDSGVHINEWAGGEISAQIGIFEAEKEDIINAIGSENFGIAKLPKVLINDKEVQMQCLDGYILAGVNACTKYPAAAQALAYYLTNENAQLKFYEDMEMIPTNKNLVQQNDTIKSDPLMKAYRQQSPYTKIYHETIGNKYYSAGISDDFVKRIEELQGEVFDTELKAKLAEIQNKIDR